MLLVANLVNDKLCEKSWKITETLTNGYSSESTHQELSNAYRMEFKNSAYGQSAIIAILMFPLYLNDLQYQHGRV